MALCIKDPSRLKNYKRDDQKGDESAAAAAEKKQREPYLRVLKWNKIFLISCVIGVCIDPLFLYIPITDEENKCLRMDRTTTIVAILLRSLTDLLHIASILYNHLYLLANWSKATNSKQGSPIHDANYWLPNFLRSSLDKLLVADHHIPLHYDSSWTLTWHFLVDIFALLPFPQVIILFYFPKIAGSVCQSLTPRKFLNMLLLFQYLPRVFRVYLCSKELSRTFDSLTLHLWVRGAFNFFFYIIFAHIFGGLWYFYSMYRETACWHHVVNVLLQPAEKYAAVERKATLDCSDHNLIWLTAVRVSPNITYFINSRCPVDPHDHQDILAYDFGIYADAIKARVLMTRQFAHKFFHSFWWGLRNLSSFGGNLETSGDLEENIFATFISIMGLLLFLYLIGNLQTYIQLQTKNSEKIRQRIKLKTAEIESYLSDIPEPKKKILMVHLRSSLKEGKNWEFDKVVSLQEEHKAENGERFAVRATKMLEMEKHEKSTKVLEAQLWIENSKICDNKELRKEIMKHLRIMRLPQGDHDFNVTNLLHILPPYLARSVKIHLCFPILNKVPMLENIDKEGHEIYGYLKPVAYPESSYIIRQGEPLDLMLLITQGSLWTFSTTTPTMPPVERLERGDYYGRELLEWLLEKKKRELISSQSSSMSCSDFPISDRYVKAHKKVEGFVLMADDLERLLANCWWKFRPAATGNLAAMQAFEPLAIMSLRRHWQHRDRLRRLRSAKLMKEEEQLKQSKTYEIICISDA